jgi:hypothetical protein
VLIPRGFMMAAQEAAAGAVQGVGRQNLIAGLEQGGQGHGDGGQTRRDQPDLGRPLELGQSGAQFARPAARSSMP